MTKEQIEVMVAKALRLGAVTHQELDEDGDPYWDWYKPDRRFGICMGPRDVDTGWYYAAKGNVADAGELTEDSDLDDIAAKCGFFDGLAMN